MYMYKNLLRNVYAMCAIMQFNTKNTTYVIFCNLIHANISTSNNLKIIGKIGTKK
jgi:hypothetical protein